MLWPSKTRAATAPRRRWIRNTVTSVVTATHSHARCRRSRQPVSSAWTTGACCTYAWAATTGAARAALAVCSHAATVPTATWTWNRSASSPAVVRLLK